MYFNIYKANTYSYIDRNVSTLEEVKEFLKTETPLDFKTDPFSGELISNFNSWHITLKEGVMENEGEGYVDMLYESGALENIY